MNVAVAMEFGTTSVGEIARWSRSAENARASSIWVGEAWRELSVPLTASALATERAGIGSGVMQMFPAHPVLAALQAAQLQELSAGRFSLGVGLGASFVVERWFGIPYERPLRRAREFIEVVRGALGSRSGEPFSYAGEIFRVHKYRMPFGSDLADVPILLAAVGPQMPELAGEVADGVVLGPIHSPQDLQEVRRHLAIGASRAGRDPAHITVHTFALCAVAPDASDARELVRASLAYSAQYPHYRRRLAAEGFGEQADLIAQRVREHDQASALALVSDEMVDRFAVAGTASQCQAQVARLPAEIDELVLTLVPFRIDEHEAARRLLDGVAALAGRSATAFPIRPTSPPARHARF